MTRLMKKKEERGGRKDSVSSSQRVTRSSETFAVGGDGGPGHSRDHNRSAATAG